VELITYHIIVVGGGPAGIITALTAIKIGEVYFASTGMTSRTCEREAFRHVAATAEAPGRHPGSLPGAQALKVKLLFADRSGLPAAVRCPEGLRSGS
jgi:NADPH-dependent 2,4-dienoyl-CoA reductase/sulfur reductase-like enzyme